MPHMPSNTLRQVTASRLKDDELEDYAQQFFKYSVIIEQQSGAIRHLEKEVTEAYARVSEEHNERRRIPLQCEPSLEGLLNTLKYYGSLCEKQPQTVIDRVRIIFYASYCTQIITHEILGHPDRLWSDSRTVFARGGQLLKQHITGQVSEIPTMARAIVKFTPPIPTTRRIKPQDLAIWGNSPEQLVGKCFISTEMVRRIFYIDDFSIKRRKGAQYDVLYEDLGLDEVQTLDPSTLLGMLSNNDAELVTNALPRS